jgi:hypothetical protein
MTHWIPAFAGMTVFQGACFFVIPKKPVVRLGMIGGINDYECPMGCQD